MKKLFEEITLKDLKLKNRFARSGTWIAKATENGELTEEFFDYYEKVAKANLGFAMIGYARVLEDERANNNMVGIWEDKFIPNLKKVTEIFHNNDTPVGIQLAMGGSQIHYSGDITWKILSPTERELEQRVDKYGNKIIYKANEITLEEIKKVTQSFVDAAVRVKKAGFDMVQIHAGHGYFLSQWMNKEINTREDEYGIYRPKFLIDLYDAIRNAVGEDFIVGIKINSEEKVGDYENHEDMLELCKILDEKGIDFIEVSGAMPSRPKITTDKESFFKDFSKKLSSTVNCTTMLTGGNKTFENIENVLNDSDVDIIGISRPLISEIDLIEKWEEDSKYKAKCVSCNYCHKEINVCILNKDNK